MAETVASRIETRGGQRSWLCGNCGRKLGEIIGDRVVIRIGARELRMPIQKTPEQDCPRCGQPSTLEDA